MLPKVSCARAPIRNAGSVTTSNRIKLMDRVIVTLTLPWYLAAALCAFLLTPSSLPAQSDPPIRVAIVGLVHGHVKGFLRALPGNDSARLVAIVEPQVPLAQKYASDYHLDSKLFYTDIERMIREQHPDAVL